MRTKTGKIIACLLLMSFSLPVFAASENKLGFGNSVRPVVGVLGGKSKKYSVPLDAGVYQTIFNLADSNCQGYATLSDCHNDNIFNRPDQKAALKPLVDWLNNKIKKTDDRVRVAASLVQNIPYDYDKYNYGDHSGRAHGNRFPYETLYENAGICGEKAWLIAYLLKELGYGVATLTFSSPTHEVAGVKCPAAYSFRGTGYCFIDPNYRHMITYSGSYSEKDPYLIVPLSDGKTFNAKDDFKDGQTLRRLIIEGISSKKNYKTNKKLMKKYGM